MRIGEVPLTPPSSPEARRRAWAVAFAGFCAFLALYLTQPILPMLGQIFHAGKAAVSMTLTAATLGVALSAPLVGSVADTFGRKRVIVWSASLLAAATLLNGTATTFGELIFWRFLQGVFTPGVFAVTVAYVQEEWAGEGVGRAMALYVTGTVVGGFTGRMISAIIVSRWNWHWSFVVIGAMGAAGAVALQVLMPREKRFTGKLQGASLVAGMGVHFRNPRLLATFFAGFGVLFSLIATFSYVTFYLADPPFNLGPLALGSLYCTYLIGAAVTPSCGKVIDRYGHRAAVALAMGMGAAGMLLTLIHSLWAVGAGLAFCCTGVFVAQATATSYIGLAAVRGKALAVGIYVTFYYMGGSAGAELPGFLWHWGGWPACVGLVILVQVLTVILALLCWAPAPSRQAPALG